MTLPADIFRLRRIDRFSTPSNDDVIDNAINNANSNEANAITNSAMNLPSLRGRKGWGDRSVSKILSAIDEKRKVEFRRYYH